MMEWDEAHEQGGSDYEQVRLRERTRSRRQSYVVLALMLLFLVGALIWALSYLLGDGR